jgi:hypothetical protein
MTTLIVNAQATLMADWSCFIDDVLHQDPEMAIQQGYPGTVMPEGALSVVAVEPDLVDLELLRAGRLRRCWKGHARALEGSRLSVEVEKRSGVVTTTFADEAGVVVALERLEEAEPPTAVAEPDRISFRAGPIDLSRIRALLWSIDLLRGNPQRSWGNEPRPIVDRAVGLLLPSLVAARAATGPARWSSRVTELICQPTGEPIDVGATLEASVREVGGRREIQVFAAGAQVASATATVEP